MATFKNVQATLTTTPQDLYTGPENNAIMVNALIAPTVEDVVVNLILTQDGDVTNLLYDVPLTLGQTLVAPKTVVAYGGVLSGYCNSAGSGNTSITISIMEN